MNREGLLILREHAAPYRGRLLGLSGLVLLASLGEGLGIGLFYPLLEYIQRGPDFLSSGAAARLASALALVGVVPSVGVFIVLIFLVICLTLTVKFLVSTGTAGLAERVMKDLRDRAFARLIRLHVFHFYATSSASLSQTLENEVEHIGQVLNFGMLLLAAALSILIYSGFLVALSWKLTALVAVLGALRYGVGGLFIRRTRMLGVEHGLLRERLKSILTSIHQGIDVVKSFGTEERETSRFAGLTTRVRDNAESLLVTHAAHSFAEGLLGDALLCGVIWVAVSAWDVSGTTLLTFLFIVSRVIPKVAAINDARIRIAEYLSRVSLLPRALSGAGLPELAWGTKAKASFDDKVLFEKVSFSYPGSEMPSVQDVSFTLRKGETLALVGESGAGKSTVARLLLRLFDPSAGRILVDGSPLAELRREDWTRLVGVVSQDTFVFDDTLENNVKYGAPDASPQQLQEALRRARCTDFVAAMPEKERTVLGERGVRLSGGQRQRIAIARAFLRDAPILILDEATSAMDAATEKAIQEAIAELAKDRTMLVIAHRFTTIRGAGRIVVLEGGRIVEEGTHERLLSEGRLYRKFHELQSK
ncbi:MAG: ABC transporter ATP-binding protein [Elusimicrobia bacterium]|nr:ABC transporter ATP-binding protein [Elusimicrobiota bacterium]